MASLSEMRSAVNRERRINSELHSELSALESGVYEAGNRFFNLTEYINNTLQTGCGRIENSHERAIQAYELQGEIEKMYRLFKNIELANKQIRKCKNKVYYEFANYNAVRKIMQAILNNIEISFVSTNALTKAVEVKHLQTPDYWLTCALLAIMAWQNDDKELAEKALQRAVTLDKKMSCIFFFVFNLRVGRASAALNWLNAYISCERTGEDEESIILMFAIICNTLKEDCDDKIVSKVNSFINGLINEQKAKQGYSEEEIINRIRMYLTRFRRGEGMNYPHLANYCTEVNFLYNQLLSAKSNVKVLEFIVGTVNITSQEKNNFLDRFIDKVIDTPNSAESDVQNEIRYNEMIISNKGNVEQAKQEYSEWLNHKQTDFDIITEMVDWVYKGGNEDINPVMKKSMFSLTKEYSKAAIDRNVSAYRQQFRRTLNVKINDYQSVVDFSDINKEHGKVDAYYNEIANNKCAEQKIWPAFIWFGVAVLGVVAAIFLMNPVFLVATLVGAIGGVVKILTVSNAKKRIIKDAQLCALSVKDILNRTAQEYIQYEQEFREYDAYYERIAEEFEKLR